MPQMFWADGVLPKLTNLIAKLIFILCVMYGVLEIAATSSRVAF
jgi:hypothetical protein